MPDAGDAAGGRGAAYACHTVGAPVPQLFEHVIPEVVAGMLAAIDPWISAETNVNFIGPMTAERFEHAWSADTAARLATVRRQYDPTSVFGLTF